MQQLDVMDLADSAGLSVDTVRYYRKIGLLHPPERRGRKAFYDGSHLDRLRKIREMGDRGFSLKAISAILDGTDGAAPDDKALHAAIWREGDEHSYSSKEFAAKIGIPHAILRSVERVGLFHGRAGDAGMPSYSEADARAADGAMRLMKHGFPLTELLSLATRHDRAMRETVDGAIDLFDDHVRKRADGREPAAEDIADVFEELLPVTTALVAHHFQRLLVNRALERLKESGQRRHLKKAIQVTKRSRLRLPWR